MHLIFQYLGFKTQKHILNITSFPFEFDVTLQEEDFQLKEVVVVNGENPANEIIRNAIKSKKKNAAKTDKFEADFYSRGIFRAKDIPKKFMGVEIGDLEGNLDSTRSGIIYQSETVSKIKFQKPDDLKEEIIASKIAGDDNGFSYNTALKTNYDFYDNYVEFNINMVSPIADNAFNYYKYKLESTFYNESNQLINKILVTPKRDKEPVFEGYIYIVEDSWDKIEYPKGSGEYKNLDEVSKDISNRLCKIFLKDENGNRAFNGGVEKFNQDPHFKDYIMFFEYFHGDNGRGVGASHQTGWTSTVAKLIQPRLASR